VVGDIFIGLGSNLGERENNVWRAVDIMEKHPHLRVIGVSTLLTTAPLGPISQPDFINAVAKIETDLTPLELLDVLLEIERRMGRVRGEKWGPRTIDLDILIFGKQTVNDPRLTVPHPEIENRPFILDGLKELGHRYG